MRTCVGAQERTSEAGRAVCSHGHRSSGVGGVAAVVAVGEEVVAGHTRARSRLTCEASRPSGGPGGCGGAAARG